MLLCYLLIARQRQQVTMLNAALEYNRALARLRHVKRRMVGQKRLRRKPGHTDQWWKNLFEGRMLESEWKKNFRMSRDVFLILVDEVRPFLEPRLGPLRDDVLSVEKQLAMTLYYLKDHGSILMLLLLELPCVQCPLLLVKFAMSWHTSVDKILLNCQPQNKKWQSLCLKWRTNLAFLKHLETLMVHISLFYHLDKTRTTSSATT